MKKIKMGMVGGGEGAFIGAVHRIAAFMDGNIELVCGAFSSDPKRSKVSGHSLFLPTNRCYDSYQEMFECESKLPAEEKMDFVSIVTPNHLHFPIAKMAFEYGFEVLSDKPATINLQEALALKQLINKHSRLYGLTHVYTGYPLIKHTKALIENGELGNIVKVFVEYSQGWLSDKEDESGKQASWRLDPNQSGISCCIADIGVHAANLVEYVTGQSMVELCSDLTNSVAGRTLDDDGTVLFKLANGAKGVCITSQISLGEENNLVLKVYGDKKSIEWHQQDPNTLLLKSKTEPTKLIRTGVGEFPNDVTTAMRTPAGHPEGYLEAFANIYQNFARQIRAKQAGEPCSNLAFDVPGIEEAVRGMAFIEQAVQASQSSQKWHNFTIPQESTKKESSDVSN